MSDTAAIAQIRNISPYGPLDTPLLRHVDIVEVGEIVDVTAEDAAVLLAQFENWAPVDAPAIAITATHVAEQQQRHRDATGEPSPSDLKPAWVAFAQNLSDPDPDALNKTKDQLMADHGTQLADPLDLAHELAAYGEEIATDTGSAPEPPAIVDPPPDPPADPDAGDGKDGDQS